MYGNMAMVSMALVSQLFAPHCQVRDEHAQDHDNHNSCQAVKICILDGLDGCGEHLAVAFRENPSTNTCILVARKEV